MALTAAQAHEWLQRAARESSQARTPEEKAFRKARYDAAYRLYTNPFGVDKYAPAITPKN